MKTYVLHLAAVLAAWIILLSVTGLLSGGWIGLDRILILLR